jgi:hypothetical protein
MYLRPRFSSNSAPISATFIIMFFVKDIELLAPSGKLLFLGKINTIPLFIL